MRWEKTQQFKHTTHDATEVFLAECPKIEILLFSAI